MIIRNHIFRMTLAGLPATIVSGSTFLVTTTAAATTELSPIVTPGRIVAPAPIQTREFKTRSCVVVVKINYP